MNLDKNRYEQRNVFSNNNNNNFTELDLSFKVPDIQKKNIDKVHIAKQHFNEYSP